jgi:DNA-binding transcriptional MerR regulator
MNHSKWIPNARAILLVRNTLNSSGNNVNARFSITSSKPNETRSETRSNFTPRLRRQSATTTNNRFNSGKKSQWQSLSPREAHNSTTKHKLVLSGLPTTLLPADFNRLSADKLAGWNEIISHVHQERDPWTMEPLGIYHITFSSSAAATLYKNKIERLLRLAQIKFQTKNGLWTSKIPSVLLEPGKDPEKELERFTILPGSYQARIKTKQSRVQGKMAWQHVIDQIIKTSHIKTLRPSAVLIELPEKSFSTSELKTIINQDGTESGYDWATETHIRSFPGYRFRRQDLPKYIAGT